jgi:hypothetical protein
MKSVEHMSPTLSTTNQTSFYQEHATSILAASAWQQALGAGLYSDTYTGAAGAANIVTVEVYAMDTFHLAGEFRSDIADTLRCRAHATVLLRQMRGLLRDYRRGQAARDKALTEMHPAAMERAGYWFLSGASDFNWLDDNNQPDPKHYPDIGFRAAGRPGRFPARRQASNSEPVVQRGLTSQPARVPSNALSRLAGPPQLQRVRLAPVHPT